MPSYFPLIFLASEVLLFTQISEVLCDELPPVMRDLWLDLRLICLSLIAPSIPSKSIMTLYTALKNWASRYEELAGDTCGIPKLHYTFHIVSSILHWSVPSLNWCFIHEGKLGVFKKLVALKNGKGVHVCFYFHISVSDFLDYVGIQRNSGPFPARRNREKAL